MPSSPASASAASLPVPRGPDTEAARLAVLRILSEQPNLSQRELSRDLGLSLGKTHYLLHALLDKGLVKARNFRRSDRKLAYAYVLTPGGLREKLRLTREFLAHKESEYLALRLTIDALRAELAQQGSGEVVPSRERAQ
jgi:EPS-associated MarR family transcriptional regulator